MSQTVVERTVEHIAESAQKASRATCAVADAIEDGVGVVRRAAKQGVEAAEEFLNDTTHRIQRYPSVNRCSRVCGRPDHGNVGRLDDVAKGSTRGKLTG